MLDSAERHQRLSKRLKSCLCACRLAAAARRRDEAAGMSFSATANLIQIPLLRWTFGFQAATITPLSRPRVVG